MIKLPCWRCIVIYMCSLPPVAAYLVYRKWKNDEGFKQALVGLEHKLRAIKDEGDRYETAVKAAEKKTD
jgi:hypothetical protein